MCIFAFDEHAIFKFSEHEGFTYLGVCTFLPFFFSFHQPCRDAAISRSNPRTTATSGYSRNYSDAPRTNRARKRKKPVRVPVLCVFSSFCALSPAGFTASPFSVPPSRGNTKQRVHARKILCRIRRSLA